MHIHSLLTAVVRTSTLISYPAQPVHPKSIITKTHTPQSDSVVFVFGRITIHTRDQKRESQKRKNTHITYTYVHAPTP